MISWIQQLSWSQLLVACALLGLAPFAPPHVWEKLVMLFNGELSAPIDIFDLLFHGAPWIALMIKAGAWARERATASS